MICGEIGYTPFEFYNLLPKEGSDILEGYNNKISRENERFRYQAKVARKAAFITILPHVKNLSERTFNMQVWPIDEVVNPDEEKSRIEKAQKALVEHNKKLSEGRRKKDKKK